MNTLRAKHISLKPRLRDFLAVLLLTVVSYNTYAQLPNPGMEIVSGRTAILITDPQNDFLSPGGVTWGVVGNSVTENNTVEHIESLMKAARLMTCRCLFHLITTIPQIMAGSSRVHWKR